MLLIFINRERDKRSFKFLSSRGIMFISLTPIEPLNVQCLGNYLEPFWGSIWNLLAQSITKYFQEPCIINAGTLNGSPKAGALG